MKKFFVFIVFLSIVTGIYAQNKDTINNLEAYGIPDSIIQNINFSQDDFNIQDDIFTYKTEIQTQKLLKNLFLAGFVFMSLVVIFLFYINNVKIKQILKMVKEEERIIALKNFEIDKLSIILNNTVDGIAIIDNDNKLLWTNTSFQNIYGFSKDEMENLNFNAFMSDNEQVTEMINRVKTEKNPVQFSFEIKNKAGDTLYIQRRIIPITDSENNVDNFAIIDTDLTALKLALNQNKKQ